MLQYCSDVCQLASRRFAAGLSTEGAVFRAVAVDFVQSKLTTARRSSSDKGRAGAWNRRRGEETRKGVSQLTEERGEGEADGVSVYQGSLCLVVAEAALAAMKMSSRALAGGWPPRSGLPFCRC